MDVARFKYPPHWVPLSTVFDSMKPNDPVTNRSRGYVILKNKNLQNASYLCRILLSNPEWPKLAKIWTRIQNSLEINKPTTLEAAITIIIFLLFDNQENIFQKREPPPETHKDYEIYVNLIEQIKSLVIYNIIERIIKTNAEAHPFLTKASIEIITIVFICLPSSTFSQQLPNVRDELTILSTQLCDQICGSPQLKAEV